MLCCVMEVIVVVIKLAIWPFGCLPLWLLTVPLTLMDVIELLILVFTLAPLDIIFLYLADTAFWTHCFIFSMA